MESDRLYAVQSTITSANQELARALGQAAPLVDSDHPILALASTHEDLIDAYVELRRAIDRAEQVMDSIDPDYGSPTPRQIKDDHADRLKEQYDGPVLNIALMLLEQNRREWLHGKPETQGADAVRRHGLTANQRRCLNDLQDAWRAYDGGDER